MSHLRNELLLGRFKSELQLLNSRDESVDSFNNKSISLIYEKYPEIKELCLRELETKSNSDISINKHTLNSIVKFLVYSLEPIDYQYESLTEEESKLVTKVEFEKIISLVREMKD